MSNRRSLSSRKIAKLTGMDEKTVRNDLAGNILPKNGKDLPPSTRALLSQSDQNDWRTPRKYLEAARQAEAKALVGAGLSLRDAAKKLGVGKTTLDRDVSPKETNASQKGTAKSQSSPPKSPPSDPEEERK